MEVPWWLKLGSKIVLSRLPVPYVVWRRVGIFRHGHMDKKSYLARVFYNHVDRAGLRPALAGAKILELGAGDSVGTAVLAAAHGAEAVLVDAGRFAVSDVSLYRELSAELRASGLDAPEISGPTTLQEILNACNAQYLTEGLASLSRIETDSIDLVFSQAVLEHVRLNEFQETMEECKRVLKTDGVASHRIDLKDHLAGGLNNLRFRRALWESRLFANSGFYTNRIRYKEMIKFFEDAGFVVEIVNVSRWPHVPIDRSHLDREFQHLTQEELLIRGFDAVLRPREF